MIKFYSDHAQERMRERGINKYDIEDAVSYGTINKQKSSAKTDYYEHNNLKVVLSKDKTVITAFRDENHNLKSEIDSLKIEADFLAQQFRQFFDQASSSYEAGLKAEAKYYSELGHACKNSCMFLNENIKLLFQLLSTSRNITSKSR